MSVTDSDDVISRLLDRFLPEIVARPGPLVIHTGHFLLLPNSEGVCTPSVDTMTSPAGRSANADAVRDVLSRFSLDTWRVGAGFTAKLRELGHDATLVILVNDWQYLRSGTPRAATAMRAAFYKSNRALFPSYMDILAGFGLTEVCLRPYERWHPFISEYWLRRRIERRLKSVMKKESSPSGLRVEKGADGHKRIVYDEYGRISRLLVCGQADCAGEVTELVCGLHETGVRQLINVVPEQCQVPVDEGTRRAISIFKLADFVALNIAVPCLSAVASGFSPLHRARVSRVSGEYSEDDRVDGVVEPLLFESS